MRVELLAYSLMLSAIAMQLLGFIDTTWPELIHRALWMVAAGLVGYAEGRDASPKESDSTLTST